MTKTNEQRTKRKRQQEAKAVEDRREIKEFISVRRERHESIEDFNNRVRAEIDDFLTHEYVGRAKAREIIEEYLDDTENTGERE